jgi:hypothetical protein
MNKMKQNIAIDNLMKREFNGAPPLSLLAFSVWRIANGV